MMILKKHVSAFIASLDGALHDLTRSLPPDLLPQMLHRLIPFLNSRDTTMATTRRSTRKNVPIMEALKLAVKALSLDEFLSLLRLTDFKEDIMNMNMGTTLKDIAAASVENGHDPDTYLDAIKTITRSQANRLSKFLMRWHERRKAKIENIKKKRSKRKLKLDAAKDDEGDE